MLKIIIPMAGRGSRFAGSAHFCPKPLIEVLPGRTMVEMALSYLSPKEPHRFIFVCLKEHVREFKLKDFFGSLTKSFDIVSTDKVTRGPACTALLAAKRLGRTDELLIAYCDDYLDIRIDRFLAAWRKRRARGGLLLFPSGSLKNSYAVADGAGNVRRVAEKKRISGEASTGLYYFKEGREFVRCARRMVRRNRRSVGEFFVSTVYNELLEDGSPVVAFRIPAAANCGMGTPSELRHFMKHFRL